MERKEIEEKVKAFLIDELEVDEDKIAPDALLKEDIGIDSLDFVDIVVIVERDVRLQDQARGDGRGEDAERLLRLYPEQVGRQIAGNDGA